MNNEIKATQKMTVAGEWAKLLNGEKTNVFIIQGQQLNIDSLTKVIQNVVNGARGDSLQELAEAIATKGVNQDLSLKAILEVVEVACIKKFLEKAGGNISKAERMARLNRGGLYSRRRILGM